MDILSNSEPSDPQRKLAQDMQDRVIGSNITPKVVTRAAEDYVRQLKIGYQEDIFRSLFRNSRKMI